MKPKSPKKLKVYRFLVLSKFLNSLVFIVSYILFLIIYSICLLQISSFVISFITSFNLTMSILNVSLISVGISVLITVPIVLYLITEKGFRNIFTIAKNFHQGFFVIGFVAVLSFSNFFNKFAINSHTQPYTCVESTTNSRTFECSQHLTEDSNDQTIIEASEVILILTLPTLSAIYSIVETIDKESLKSLM